MQTEKSVGAFASAPERERKEVILPSGRTITVLETTGHEEGLFKRGDIQKNLHTTINKFLIGVCENLDGKPGKPSAEAFDEMLVGDRTAILLHVRVLTHGSSLSYNMECAACQAQSEQEIDLLPILEGIVPYPHGDRREHSLDLGRGVLHFELPTGKTEKRMANNQEADVNMQLSFLRIWEDTEKGPLPIRLENLKSKDIATLRKTVKSFECKIDQTAKVVCPSCGQHAEVRLVENPNFLFPNLM